MKTVKIILLILTVLAFVVFSFFFLAGKGVENTVLNEDFYEKVFNETDLAGVLSDNVSAVLKDEVAEGVTDAQEKDTKKVTSEPINEVFDEVWIKENIPELTGNMLAWLKGERESDVFLDLGYEKVQLQGEIKSHMSNLSSEELVRMGLSPMEIKQVKSGNIPDTTEDVPSVITAEDVFADEELSESIEERRASFQANYERFQTWPYAALVLFVVLFIFTAGIFSGSKWMGGIMLFAGLVVFAAMHLFSGLISAVVSGQLDSSPNAATMEDISSIFVSEFTQPSLIYGVIGLIMLVAGIVGRRIFKRAKFDNSGKHLSTEQAEESGNITDSQATSGIS